MLPFKGGATAVSQKQQQPFSSGGRRILTQLQSRKKASGALGDGFIPDFLSPEQCDLRWVVQLPFHTYEIPRDHLGAAGRLRAATQVRQTDPGSWVAGTLERRRSLESVFSVVLLYRAIK